MEELYRVLCVKSRIGDFVEGSIYNVVGFDEDGDPLIENEDGFSGEIGLPLDSWCYTFVKVDEESQTDALLKLVEISKKDIKEGRSMSAEEVLKNLKEERKIKYDPFLQLEGLERVSMLVSIIHDKLGYVFLDEEGKAEYHENEDLHPSLYDDKAKVLLAKATECVLELYQHIGAWKEVEEESSNKSVDN